VGEAAALVRAHVLNGVAEVDDQRAVVLSRE
jgi:hypothetical protein